MKKGSFLVNNARGAICDPPAVVEALKSGQLRGTARSHHLESFRILPSNAPLLARRQCHSKHFQQGDLLQAYSKQHVLLRCVQPGANLWRPSTRRRFPDPFAHTFFMKCKRGGQRNPKASVQC